MRNLSLGLLCAAVIAVAGCNAVPPTVVMMVVTNTPDPRIVPVTVTPTTEPPTTEGAQPAVATDAATSAATTPAPITSAATFGPTQTLSPFPTDVRAQLYIGQEDYEHGYMYWISTQKQIWVLFDAPNNPNSGTWKSFPDTFVDGEPEVDPNLIPPGPNLYQPRRGFGKLWRSNDEVRSALGWATTPEFALNTNYVYQHGGYLDSNNTYIAQPGTHFITALNRQTFALSEPPNGSDTGTWKKVG